MAEKLGAPFLGEIPLEIAIRKGGDEGKPIVATHPEAPESRPFLELARAVRERCEGSGEGREKRLGAEKKGFFSSLFTR